MQNKLWIWMCLFTLGLWAQNGEISGIVYVDDQPVEGAEVYVKGIHLKGTTTDTNGNFLLSGLNVGSTEVYFSYVGAVSQTRKITIKKNIQSISVNLTSDTHLDEVIISVPGSRLQKDLVVNVEKKKLSDINKASSNTLAESITNINGVSQNSTGSSIGKPVIRGLTSNRVVTYAQGTRIENQQWGAEHGLGISSNGIKSVEVIKGPASLLYGSDAIGGVLYFVDEDFTKQKVEGAIESGYFTNTRTTQNRGGIKLGFGDFKINAFGGYTLAGDYKLPNDANFAADRAFNTRFSERSAKIALGLVKENYSTKFTYSYLNNFFGIPVPTEGNPAFTNSFDVDLIDPIFANQADNFVLPFQDVTQHVFALENNFKIKEANLLLTLGYSINDRQEFNETRNNPDLYLYLDVYNYNLKVSDIVKTSKIDVTLGAQGLFQDSENRGSVFLIPDGTSLENGVFGLLNYKATEQLRFQSGVRFDSKNVKADGVVINEFTSFSDFNETYNTLNYSVGTKYDTGNFTFRFNVASGYRAPNVSELLSNGEHGGTGQIEVGDVNLNSESATQFDFAITYKNNDFDITLNPFYNRISDYIFIAPTGERRTVDTGELPVFAYLQEDATLFGGEFNLNYIPNFFPKLSFQTGAALTYGNNNDGNPLPFIPPVNFNTKISYDLSLGHQFKLNSIYLQQQNFLEQNRIADNEFKNDDYHLVDIGLNASYKEFNFSLAVKNIVDQEYTDHLSRLKTTYEGFSVPNPGRDIVFNLKYNF
ncbi:TonB-dependent receptor [Aquimarina agarilytica]|uniref:TonB-dependent receptor n=1 Tax=Aquimarina agarilytica TaxID=1087449 RepID=UPI00028A2998|nr:TonB-dependent receptor [Aquimarina agarilytica]